MVSWKEVMVGFHQLSPNGDPDQKLRLVYRVSYIIFQNVLFLEKIFNFFIAHEIKLLLVHFKLSQNYSIIRAAVSP